MAKNKKIKLIALTGGVVFTALAVNGTKSLAINSTTTKTVKEIKANFEKSIPKESRSLNPTIVETFENSLIAELASESKNLKEISMEQTSTGKGKIKNAEIKMHFTFDELPEMKNTEVLKDLINKFYKEEINKNTSIRIVIKTEKEFIDHESKNERTSNLLTYRISKISDSELHIDKTAFYGIDDWNHYYKIYEANTGSMTDTDDDGYDHFKEDESPELDYEVTLNWTYNKEDDSTFSTLDIEDRSFSRNYYDSVECMKAILEEIASDRDMEFDDIYVRTMLSKENKMLRGKIFSKEDTLKIEAVLSKTSETERTYAIVDNISDSGEVVIKIAD